jgi:class 3 adenylate cyclase
MAEQRAQTNYARTNEGASIAYQCFGEGSVDLVFIPSWLTHVEAHWEEPERAKVLHRLGSFSRVILFDKRGVGMSDPISTAQLPTIEEWAQDVLTILDAVGSEHAVIVAGGPSGPMAMVFAATFPDRVSGLVLANTYARMARAADYPFGPPADIYDRFVRDQDVRWGTGGRLELFAPDLATDDGARQRWGRWERLSASPGTAQAMARFNFAVDVRAILKSIRVPTLVVHNTDNAMIRIGHGRYLAEHIPGATFAEAPGQLATAFGLSDTQLDEIEEFATGARQVSPPDRILTTVMFTDVVSSTEQMATIGDMRWRELLDSHDALVRRQLERYRGNEIKWTGDGILATFDGPARAIRCAADICAGVRPLGIEVRAGLHTGEVDVRGTDLSGIAVHTAKRVEAHASPGEVLVSRTVVDLVAGSGIEFDSRGEHQLKGVPGTWQLFAMRN